MPANKNKSIRLTAEGQKAEEQRPEQQSPYHAGLALIVIVAMLVVNVPVGTTHKLLPAGTVVVVPEST